MTIPIGKRFIFANESTGKFEICEVVENNVSAGILTMSVVDTNHIFKCNISELGKKYKPYYQNDKTAGNHLARTVQQTKSKNNKPYIAPQNTSHNMTKGIKYRDCSPRGKFKSSKGNFDMPVVDRLDIDSLPRPDKTSVPGAKDLNTDYGYSKIDGSPNGTPTPRMGYHWRSKTRKR